MRQPTVSRRRQQRLLRTAIGVVVVVAVAGAVVSLVGGDKDETGAPADKTEPGTPRVAFKLTRLRAETDARKKTPEDDLRSEGQLIVKMLNDWYQRAFVDPKQFGDGTYPQVVKYIDPEARGDFQKDINSLTIGEARTELERVEPLYANTRVTVFFERSAKPRYATADVRFGATGIFEDGRTPSLNIRQRSILTLKRTAGGWVVVAYEAEQAQRQPTLRPSPTPSP